MFKEKKIICLSKIEELRGWVKNDEPKFILLVSGKIGEELGKIGFNSENMIGQYVFC